MASNSSGPSSFPSDPQTFDADERVSYSTLDKKFLLVDINGDEYEFDDALKRWVPILDEELLAQQQAAYKVAGVDENETVEEMRKRKREESKQWVNGEDEGGRAAKPAKKQKTVLPPRLNTAVYVTGLPSDVTMEEVAEVFSKKCGVIAEEIDSGKPRIKLYTDEEGKFKGDALVVFFKAPSVQMAITLLDDTEFRYGDSMKMKVVAADSSYKKVKIDDLKAGNGKAASTLSKEEQDAAKDAERERQRKSARDKAKIIKKTQKLDAKIADWSDDEEIAQIGVTGTGFAGRKPLKVVVLKHMFTLPELEEDPAAILDIKEDIREECEKLGEVTNVVLYDLEEDGVASVKFREEEAASECVRLMDGRAFDGRVVRAYLSEGKENFKKSGKEKKDEDEDEES